MKKLIMCAVILFTAFSCETDEAQQQRGSEIVKAETNVKRFATDLTDDDIENFIVADQQDTRQHLTFEYNSTDKTIIANVLTENKITSTSTYEVISEENGNILVRMASTVSTFRFVSDKEVTQTFKEPKYSTRTIFLYK